MKIVGWTSVIVYASQISGKVPQLKALTFPITPLKPEKLLSRQMQRSRVNDKRVQLRRSHLNLYLQHPSFVHPRQHHLHNQQSRRAGGAPCAIADLCITKVRAARNRCTPLRTLDNEKARSCKACNCSWRKKRQMSPSLACTTKSPIMNWKMSWWKTHGQSDHSASSHSKKKQSCARLSKPK